jgi:hypothetical protein
LELMMRDDALAQGDELGLTHVVLGIIGPPSTYDEAPCAVGFEHVIDGGQQREAEFVGGLIGLLRQLFETRLGNSLLLGLLSK